MTTVRIPTCLGCIHCEKQMMNSVLNTMHVKMTCKFPGDAINPPPRIDTIPAEYPDGIDEINKLMVDQNNYMIDFLIKE